MKTITNILTVAFVGLSLMACNQSGQRSDNDAVEVAQGVNDSTAKVNNEDAEFAVKVADAGLAEIALANLALEKTDDERVKELATQMVQEHKKIQGELETLAEKHNITLPPVTSSDQVENQRELMEKSGPEFDRDYLTLMTNQHNNLVALFDDAAEDAQHPDVKAFAASMLPELERHQEHAKALRDSIVPPVDPATAPVVTP